MIKIIEEGQKTFTRTCDRCGCKFQYDLSDLRGLDFIDCPCCRNALTHLGPHTKKVGPNDTYSDHIDADKVNWDKLKTYITPCKVEVGDGGYNYATTTGEYINPNTATTISVGDIDPKSDSVTLTGGDPNVTIYANNLPDDIVDDSYNKIGSELPDDIAAWAVRDDCQHLSEQYREWYDSWTKEIDKNREIKCKKKQTSAKNA